MPLKKIRFKYCKCKKQRWSKIPNWPGYKISDHGRCKSYKKYSLYGEKHLLKGQWSKKTYRHFTLYKNGKSKVFRAQRLVLMVFRRLPKRNEESAHIDGNSKNNCYKNLKWTSHLANIRHKKLHNTDFVGERNPSVLLTEKKVRRIRRLYKIRKYYMRQLGKKFGVTRHAIWRIIHRKTWRHV